MQWIGCQATLSPTLCIAQKWALRDARGQRSLTPYMLKDVQYAIRTLLQSPGFASVAVLSLGLGIGANTTIFSLVSALFLQPLPVEKPEQLVMVYTSDFSGPAFGSSAYPDFVDFRDKTDVFSGLLASAIQPLSMTTLDLTEQIYGEITTTNFFTLLGVKPHFGRAFLPEENQTPGAHPVAVLSYGFWKRRFGSDPNLIGQSITLNGISFTVVGIAPEGFTGVTRFFPADIWVPISMQPQLSFGRDRLESRGSRWLSVVGRLKSGITVEKAQASMTVLARQLKQAYDRNWTDVKGQGRRITVLPESAARVPPSFRSEVLGFTGLLFAAVGLVLLIACSNVANLLLTRATRRQKEIAIRLSLGAGRMRLIRQLMTESLVLSTIGGALGLLLAYWCSDLLLAFRPPIPFPLFINLRIDHNVLTFALIVSILTGLLFGLTPALQASRQDLVSTLKDESGTSAGGYRQSRLRNAFVIPQVALSLLLLIGAGLFIRSLRNASTIDPGFDTHNLLLLSVNLRLHGYDDARGKEFFRQLMERVESLPGVESAAFGSQTPLSLFGSRRGTFIEGYTQRPGEDLEFHYSVVGPAFHKTLRIPMVLGRAFTPDDREGAKGVVIVNESFARRFWHGENPLGRRLSVTGPQGTFLEVIGVAKDGKYNTLGEDPTPFFYFPSPQNPGASMTLFVRTSSDPLSLLPAVRKEIRELDRNLPVTDIKTMNEHLGVSLFPARLAAVFLGIFGSIALVLAAIGIYGVMSYSVGQRTREIGIRMALGAGQHDVLRLVLGQGMLLALIGLGMGLAGSLALTRYLSSLLYGVSTTDAATFFIVPLVLGSVALLASYVPARRAMNVDPMAALRYE